MSTVYLADFPSGWRPTGSSVLRATANEIVWRQTLSDNAGNVASSDLYYLGDFTYLEPGKLDGVTGTVTEVKNLFENDLLTFHWSGFSSSLEAMDRADMTVGGWDEFYRNVLLPGDDVINSTRSSAERLQGHTGDDTITTGTGDDTLEGGSGLDYLRGGGGNDTLAGGADFDDINGNQGDDTASGGDGADWVVGGQNRDLLNGDGGDDIVLGNLGEDTCYGGDGADTVRGGQDADLLSGGGGNDWLSGDRGDDTISGGFGADTFHSSNDAGVDRVTDFNRAEGDRVLLDAGTSYEVSQSGADVVIAMGGGARMVLVGVSLASLTGDWLAVG